MTVLDLVCFSDGLQPSSVLAPSTNALVTTSDGLPKTVEVARSLGRRRPLRRK